LKELSCGDGLNFDEHFKSTIAYILLQQQKSYNLLTILINVTKNSYTKSDIAQILYLSRNNITN